MNHEALFEEIQTFLNNKRETSDEAKEEEKLLEEFYQIPSYVERLKRAKQEEA